MAVSLLGEVRPTAVPIPEDDTPMFTKARRPKSLRTANMDLEMAPLTAHHSGASGRGVELSHSVSHSNSDVLVGGGYSSTGPGGRPQTPSLGRTFDSAADPEKDIMKSYAEISGLITEVCEYRQVICELATQTSELEDPSQESALMSKVDDIMVSCSQVARRIKQLIVQNKAANDQFRVDSAVDGSSVAQWRANRLHTLSMRFSKENLAFQDSLTHFRTEIVAQQRRQIRIYRGKDELAMSEADMQRLEENPEAASVYLQDVLRMGSTSDALISVLGEMEKRYEGMLKIQEGIREINQMFCDLSTLILEQQEMLDSIAHNCEKTLLNTQKGVKQLHKARESQKCTRKMSCCLLCGGLAVLFILLISLTQSNVL